jgi:ribosomal protein S18 acetylase RimI-like enzyme
MRSESPIKLEAVTESRRNGFLISTDPALLDLNVIHGFLTNCYWAKGIPRELVERAIVHSLCFGIYDVGGEEVAGQSGNERPAQVGFARVVSDFATFAYIADVFVLESHRGRGLGKDLMRCIKEHPELQGLRRWSLSTLDAHKLYEQFGFTPPKFPERYMEILRLNIYEKAQKRNSLNEK